MIQFDNSLPFDKAFSHKLFKHLTLFLIKFFFALFNSLNIFSFLFDFHKMYLLINNPRLFNVLLHQFIFFLLSLPFYKIKPKIK